MKNWPSCITQITLSTHFTHWHLSTSGRFSANWALFFLHITTLLPVLITGWACHLHWAQVLLPARLTEIESPSHLPKRAEAKGLHTCQGLSCKTGQLFWGEPHPARQSRVTSPLGYDIPGNEVNVKTFVGFTLSFQCSLWSALNISLEVQQKVSYYFSIFNILFSIVVPLFSIILYSRHSLLALKI